MSLLEYDIVKKGQVDNKALLKLEKNVEFEIRGKKKYEIKTIIDSAAYN